MILILEPNARPESADFKVLTSQLDRLPGIAYRVHREVGAEVTLTEIYLIGNTGALTVEQMQVLPCVEKVVRVSETYRVLGRHKHGDDRPASFEYNGVKFGQDTLHVFAGLCAVDSPESADEMMRELQNAVDLFRPGFDEESPGRFRGNTELLWREVFGAAIDVQHEIIAPAILRRKQGYGEEPPDYKGVLKDG